MALTDLLSAITNEPVKAAVKHGNPISDNFVMHILMAGAHTAAEAIPRG